MVFADSNSRRPPVAPERIVHDAAQALAPQARGAGEAGELERRDELLPAVRSRLEPAQDIFGADNGEGETPQGAVDGRDAHAGHKARAIHLRPRGCRVVRDRESAWPPVRIEVASFVPRHWPLRCHFTVE
jgi:hypothetical protein